MMLAVAVAIFGIPASLQFLLRIIDDRRHVPEDPLAVACGLACAVVLIFAKKPNWFIHTLVHEVCHLLACGLLGVRVLKIVASDGKGGVVEHRPTDAIRTTLIALSPYTIPLVLAPALVFRAVIPEGTWRWILTAAAVVAYVTHLTGLVHNVRLNFRDPKGDLAIAGRPLSLAVIISVLMVVTGWTIRVLWD